MSTRRNPGTDIALIAAFAALVAVCALLPWRAMLPSCCCAVFDVMLVVGVWISSEFARPE